MYLSGYDYSRTSLVQIEWKKSIQPKHLRDQITSEYMKFPDLFNGCTELSVYELYITNE